MLILAMYVDQEPVTGIPLQDVIFQLLIITSQVIVLHADG